MTDVTPRNTSEPASRILVIKLGALGDFIQALGPMAAIRRHHPDAHITLLTTRPFKDFAATSPYFDDIWLDSRPGWFAFQKWYALRKRLNREGFDRVYDLQNNDRTAIYFRLFKHPCPEWVGVARGASHRNTSPERTAGQAFYGHRQTLKLAGIDTVDIDRMAWIPDSHISDPALLDIVQDNSVLLVPGSSPKHPEKRWPAEKYGALATALTEQGVTPVILGTRDDADAARAICALAPDAHDLTNQTTLYDIAILARHAASALGNDTGPMHIIAPTGCPSLVLFSGASKPHRHAPIGETVETLQKNKIEDIALGEVKTKLREILHFQGKH